VRDKSDKTNRTVIEERFPSVQRPTVLEMLRDHQLGTFAYKNQTSKRDPQSYLVKPPDTHQPSLALIVRWTLANHGRQE
jgi:hypothetical protein